MALPRQQEQLLDGLRRHLDALRSQNLLSDEQIQAFEQLSRIHDNCDRVNAQSEQLDAQFEQAAAAAFPVPVTATNLRVVPFSEVRAELGISPSSPGVGSGASPNSATGGGMELGSSWDAVASWAADNASPGFDEMPSLYTIVDHPVGSDAVTRFIQEEQGERCCECQQKIDRTNLGFGTYKARFCHESNLFCCEACCNGAVRCILPSYAVLRWDFTPRVCRNSYAADDELNFSKPVLCVGAEHPQLFQQVPVLEELRKLRFQLSKLVDIGARCPTFMNALTVAPAAPNAATLGTAATASAALFPPSAAPDHGSTAGGGAAAGGGSASSSSSTFYVSERQRYLVSESEMWALADLAEVHKQVPKRGPMPPGAKIGAFSAFMHTIRDAMVRHVLTECHDCKMAAGHMCLACGAETPIYSFDLRNVHECVRCSAVFHRRCWQVIQEHDETCPGCEGRTL